jgi:perosamine synthetase
MGIGTGDDVLVPDFTFAASAFAVSWCGANPVFVDIDRDTFNIDIEDCKRKWTRNTKAIMPVHIYGQSCDLFKVLEFAKEYNLKVIEDNAQGLGVSYMGKPTGGWGDVGCMSFYGDKTATCGEAGMITTDNEEIYKKAFRINNQGRDGRGWYIHAEIGLNFRLTDLQAAVGLAQLDKLPEIIKRKRHCAEEYKRCLSNIKDVKFTFVDPAGFNVPFRHNIIVKDPDKLQKHLKKEGIGTTRFFYPLHLQPCYNRIDMVCVNSMFAYSHGLSLPSSTNLTMEQITYVCDKIREYYSCGS